ncbi:VWA domain-containing protein [Spirosoma flavum]|uniref:VWA domain-containing protein n=1 Tax=Spirosoma flavum TaxID=2048557 RepID=A0ABW6AQZ5_9BACT
MQTFFCFFLLFSAVFITGGSPRETPQQALNQYIAFLNQSTDEVASRFQQIQTYYTSTSAYQSHIGNQPNLPSSGLLEEYYYRKAIDGNALTEIENQRLKTSAQALWKLITKIDQTTKALETYNRLKDYERDKFKKSNELISNFQLLTDQFSQDKAEFYKQIQRIYRRYQPYRETDAYLFTEKEMEQILVSQQHLLNTLGYYLNEKNRSNWPVELVQQSIVADEKLLSDFGKAKSAIDYPASDMLNSFKTGLQTIQDVKKQAVDDYTFAARQTSSHGNEVYRSLVNHYNNDLLSWQKNFVQYSKSIKQLLDYPKFSLVFRIDPPALTVQKTTQTEPFRNTLPIVFTTNPAVAPASTATFHSLNAYVEFINESLRQMNHLQTLVRDYQSSADHYRESSGNLHGNALTYSHEAYKVPVSEYQLLLLNSQQIPQSYRISINKQAEVLLGMLIEMDKLSIELIDYTTRKQYEQDHLQRSDAILDRYAYLFTAFDQKKEQLYRDVRRIHESYPVKKPITSWNMSGKALLTVLDTDKEILFGVKDYLRGEATQLPETDTLQAEARELIINEYKNLKGLQRFGRSNGLCPYSPYEDIAEHSLRLAEMTQKTKEPTTASIAHSYETFYYFFNNELVYAYNKFSELANVGVLKVVNQPNVFAFRRSTSPITPPLTPTKVTQPDQNPVDDSKPINKHTTVNPAPLSYSSNPKTNTKTLIQHDTVYVNRATIDTLYINRSARQEATLSLTGFAPNNMVLLLDVSASMDSPYKMPLLKKSIKSLLNVLRPEDQISIVVYSGKARVALKPTSGDKAIEITTLIDQLQSNGDTDGDGGIRLAYKLANKSYIRAGNNRIILATDGEFPVGEDVFNLVGESSTQDISLTVFTFGRNEVNGKNLKKLAQSGKGTYSHITTGNANLQLILEAQAKRAP